MFATATMDWAYIHGAGRGRNMIGWVGVRRGHCACIYAAWPDLRQLDFNQQRSNSLISHVLTHNTKINEENMYICI
jgi:hypothetical protein